MRRILVGGAMAVHLSCPHAMEVQLGMQQQCMSKENVSLHRDLLGKVKKLDGDFEIYVGSGLSDAGEPIFFGLERLDERNYDTWATYRWGFGAQGTIRYLCQLNHECNEEVFEDIKIDYARDGKKLFYVDTKEYVQNLKNDMSKPKVHSRLKNSLRGIAGITGLGDIMPYWKDQPTFVAYASNKPITGFFHPKIVLDKNKLYLLEDREYAYSDLIMCVGVRDSINTPTMAHRGIFKNPFFDIRDCYNYISMKLHGWAGTVAQKYFNKKYMLVEPTSNVEDSLQTTFKVGEMFIGVVERREKHPKGGEIEKKFPSINEDEIKGADGASPYGEDLYIIKLEALTEFYVGNRKLIRNSK